MALYSGSIYKQFIIDRLAMGYSPLAISEAFEDKYGDKLKESDVLFIASEHEKEIKERQKELMEDLNNSKITIDGRLEALYNEVKEVLDELKENKQWKQYSAVLNGLLKNIELLAKSINKFGNNNQKQDITIQKNNYQAIVLLAEDGILSIKDKEKLKKLLGLEEVEKAYV